MKTLSQLKSDARKILNIPEGVGDFKNESFSCRSGGSPSNSAGVKEVHRADRKSYNTTANGWAYYGEVVVLCKDTGTTDAEGNKIYVTPEGIVFVCEFYPGSPYNFDGACLREPKTAPQETLEAGEQQATAQACQPQKDAASTH